MLTPRFEPSATVDDWTTYNRVTVAKGRLVSRMGLVAEIGGRRSAGVRAPTRRGRRSGQRNALVWTLDHPMHYLLSAGSIGGVVGPVANRLGAREALATRRWSCSPTKATTCSTPARRRPSTASGGYRSGVTALSRRSTCPTARMGFPDGGKLEARYRFNETGDTLELDRADLYDTLVNMTHHPYWNLSGGGPLSAHRLRVPASGALTLDAEKIPTGEVSTPAKAG